MSELFKEAEVASEAAQLLKREHEELLDLRVQCQDQEAENQKLLDKIGQICGYYKSSEVIDVFTVPHCKISEITFYFFFFTRIVSKPWKHSVCYPPLTVN